MEGVRRAGSVAVVMLLAGCSGGTSGGGSSSTSSTEPARSTSASSSSAPRPPLAGRTVVLDPGHNGGNAAHPRQVNRQVSAGFGQRKACNTTGTETRDGYSEHAFAWDVARRTATRLRTLGATVVLTRTSDTGVGPCVDRRGTAGQRAGADLLLSVHADGTTDGSGRGFHVAHARKMMGGAEVGARSRALALVVRDAYARGTGLPRAGGGSGLRDRDDLGTLSLARVPAVLLESGNMRNPTDARKLSDPAFRARQAAALAQAVRQFLTTRPAERSSGG